MNNANFQKKLPILFYLTLSSFFMGIAIHQAFVIIFFLSQVYESIRSRQPFGRPLYGNVRAGLLLASTLFSAIWTSYTYYRPVHDIDFRWPFLVFWLIDFRFLKKINWETFLAFFVVLALPGMIRSVFWLFQPDEIQWALKVGFEHYPRAFGFNSNPITHSEGMMVLVCWLLARMTAPMEKIRRKWALFVIVFVLILITLSRVRSGWAAFAVICTVQAISFKEHRRLITILLCLMASGFILTVFIFGFNLESITERHELLVRGMELFMDHPILGIGPERFGDYPPIQNGLVSHPHNNFIGVLAETGMVGFVFFLVFTVSLLVRNIKLFLAYRDSGSEMAWVTRALLYVSLSFWVSGFSDYNFGSTQLLLLHGLHWAILARIPLPSETMDS